MTTELDTRVIVRLPVIELFGPTIQGEGREAGLPVHFIRLGGCDYRCSWCDTMYAVEPAQVRENADRLTIPEIMERFDHLEGAPEWVVLSGGNPALHRCAPLIEALHERHLKVAVETQGSIWRDWLAFCERVTVSPKPPSSGMATHRHREAFEEFMRRLKDVNPLATILKIVCFDHLDLAWAKRVIREHPWAPAYLSAGTPVGGDDGDTIEGLRRGYRWLCEAAANDPALSGVRVLPQLHVIAWGPIAGV